MSADREKPKPMFVHLQDMKRNWRELWFMMADGSKSEYDRIKATDVMEFWYIFDAWKERVDAQNKAQATRRR